MTNRTTATGAHSEASVVYVDGWHALIARSAAVDRSIANLARDHEAEAQFLVRVARETHDCDRIVIMGPDQARLAFEREYVALYQRPDRLVDVEAVAGATRFDLLDRLRVLEG